MGIGSVIFYFICCILFAIFVFVLYAWGRNFRIWKIVVNLPGPRVHPIYGNLLIILKMFMKGKELSPHIYLFQFICGTAYIFDKETLYRIWRMWYPVVVLQKPEGFELILGSSTSLEKSRDYDLFRPWLGMGLITSGGEKWKSRRKMLTPSFHFRILEDFVPIMNDHSNILVKELRQSVGKDSVDILPLAVRCTLDIICESAMGIHLNAQKNVDSPYLQAVLNFSELFPARNIRPWLWNDFLYSLTSSGKELKKVIGVLHDFTRKVIKERKEILLKQKQMGLSSTSSGDEGYYWNKKKRKAFLDLLLEYHIEDHALTEEDLREEVDTFMFAGHDTTSVGISWALYCIGLYPEVQAKVHSELDEIFGEDVDRPITTDDLKNMKYLECVLKESQRLYPSVPFIGRIANEDIKIDGYCIPKGVACFLFTYMLHRNSKSFPEPERFIPERFLPENSHGRHPFAYVPFSAGPRNCIGQKFALMEEKAIIGNILRRLRVKSLDPRDKVHIVAEIVLRPKGKLRLQFTERKSTDMARS